MSPKWTKRWSYLQRLNHKKNIMSVIKQTKVLRIKMIIPLTIWEDLDKAMALNVEWSNRLINRDVQSMRVSDIVHDIKGILQGCEFFLPRL